MKLLIRFTYFIGMLNPTFATMDVATFNQLPSTTNPVEVYNRLSKRASPDVLPVALMTIYKQDKVVALQHIAATNGIQTGYDGCTGSARAHRNKMQASARRRRRMCEEDDVQGPPDKKSNFDPDETPKREKKP